MESQHKELLKNLTQHSKQTFSSLLNLKDADTNAGMSFLELKNHLMLDYLIDLSLLALKKTTGQSIQGDSAVDRLVENRTVLEKMRPIESKLKYQIEKSVKIANGETLPTAEFKPNPSALISKLDSSDSDSESDENDDGNDGDKKLYKVPKHVPAYFADNPEELMEEREKKERKKNLSRSLIEDLKRQHGETPEEEFHTNAKAKAINNYKERIRFEEENFIRLPLTKKDKHKNKMRFSTVNSIGDEITSFGGFGFDNNDDNDKKRKRKKSFKKSSAKKKFKARK